MVLERLRAAGLVRLELAGEMLPSSDWFIYAFVRKEAVVSSQIEGTQATLVDLLTFEAEEDESAPDAEVEEICNYVGALAYARGELPEPAGLPLSMRRLNESHRRLMRGVRGADNAPAGRKRHRRGRRVAEHAVVTGALEVAPYSTRPSCGFSLDRP